MDGTEEQKARVPAALASGELVISFALTEPDAGSDCGGAQDQRPIATASDYVLNGTKRFITNAPRAGAFTLMARTDGPGAGGISAFIVPAGLPGPHARQARSRRWASAAPRPATSSSRTSACPPTNIIGGEPGQGLQDRHEGARPRPPAHRRRLLWHGAIASSDERRVRAASASSSASGSASFQLVQAMLADSQAELLRRAGRMVQSMARALRRARPPRRRRPDVSMQASCAKLFASEMVGRVADRGVQMHGGAGYITEYAVERFYRDVRLLPPLRGHHPDPAARHRQAPHEVLNPTAASLATALMSDS